MKEIFNTRNTSLSPPPLLHTHAMKAYRETGHTAPLAFNLDIRWRCVVSLMPQSLSTKVKEHPFLMEEESGWATEPIWTFWRTDQSLASAGI
jgi:hypothetical protein